MSLACDLKTGKKIVTGKGSDKTKIRCVQLSPTYAIASFAVSDLRNFKKVKKHVIFWKCAPVLLLLE